MYSSPSLLGFFCERTQETNEALEMERKKKEARKDKGRVADDGFADFVLSIDKIRSRE